MEENIQELFQKLNDISFKYLAGIDRNNIKGIKEALPKIQEFATWFLEENIFGIEAELYQGMCRNLIQILQDIAESLHQEDHVLLHDAIAYGLVEYLKIFVGQEEETDDSL